MLYNHNLWVPTEFGEYYYKKPPLFNWMIIGSYQLFGVSEFSTRVFSVVSLLVMGALVYWFGSRYVDKTFGVFTAILFLLSVDILFYFSLVGGEIDLFYSLLTFGSFLAIFHWYRRQQFFWLFGLTYLLAALVTLTKGLPSIVFLVISLAVFFWYQKDVKRLLSAPHIFGICLYVLVVGGYLMAYSQFNSIEGFIGSGERDSIVNQSLDRTFLEQDIWKSLWGIISFPGLLLKILLPASLFVPFLFKRGLLHDFKRNDFIWFGVIILLANLMVYWVSPGTRSRYLYMFLPLAINTLFFVFYSYAREDGKRLKALVTLMKAIMVILPLVCLALPFIPDLEVVQGRWGIAIAGFLGFGLLTFTFFKYGSHRLLLFLMAFIGLRVLFDLTILPVRAQTGKVVAEKELAYSIMEQVGERSLKLYGEARPSRTTIFYLEKELQQVINYSSEKKSSNLFLARLEDVQDEEYHLLLSFDFKGNAYGLVQFIGT